MSFTSKLDSETPQSLWAKQEEIGARMMLTMPFGSSVDKMEGFISVLGDKNSLPVLTFCIKKPSGGAIASTIVFSSQGEYIEFIDRIHLDSYLVFSDDNLLN